MKKKVEFLGVLATGATRQEAANRYRLLSLGKAATVRASESGVAFVVHASDSKSYFNPVTGDMDLVESADLLSQVEFASNSAELADEVEYAHCSRGCGQHLIAESADALKFCPMCTSKLSLSGDDEDSDDSDEEDDLDFSDADETSESSDDEDSDEDSDDSDEDSEADDSDEGLDEGDDFDSESDDEIDLSEIPDDEDEDSDEDDDSDAEEPTESITDDGVDDGKVVSVSSSFEQAAKVFLRESVKEGVSLSSELDAEYVVCTSSDCGMHIVHSSDAEVDACPVCLSACAEPESNPSGEFDVEAEDIGVEDDEDSSSMNLSEELDADEDEDTDGNSADSESGDEIEIPEDDEDSGEDFDGESDSDDEDFGDEEDDSADSESQDVAFVDYLPAGVTADELDVSYSSSIRGKSAWTAYVGGRPVAMATLDSVSAESKQIFDSSNFGKATLVSASHAGVATGLKNMGFEPIVATIEVDDFVKKQVEAGIAEVQQSVSASQASFEAEFMAALSTAAIGINRGFFKGENALKGAFWQSLSSMGVKDPEVLIDSIFSASSDAYHKALFTKAQELMGKSLEVRNEIARAVMDTRYQSQSSDEDTGMESRLGKMGKPAAAAPAVSISSGAPSSFKDKLAKIKFGQR